MQEEFQTGGRRDNRATLRGNIIDDQTRKMPEYPPDNYTKKKGKRVDFWDTVIAALAATGVAWFVRWLYLKICAPRLILTDEPKGGSQGIPWALEDHFYVENSGTRAAEKILIELSIFKPHDINIGNGLFFNDKIGQIEKAPVMDFLSVVDPTKPHVYHYRLNSSVFSGPGIGCRLHFMHIIRSAFPEDAPEKLDIEIAWKTSCPDCSSIAGRIARKGTDLKQMIVKTAEPRASS